MQMPNLKATRISIRRRRFDIRDSERKKDQNGREKERREVLMEES